MEADLSWATVVSKRGSLTPLRRRVSPHQTGAPLRIRGPSGGGQPRQKRRLAHEPSHSLCRRQWTRRTVCLLASAIRRHSGDGNEAALPSGARGFKLLHACNTVKASLRAQANRSDRPTTPLAANSEPQTFRICATYVTRASRAVCASRHRCRDRACCSRQAAFCGANLATFVIRLVTA
jgi:hypothetical protein